MAESGETAVPSSEDTMLRELLAAGERTRHDLPQQLRHRIGFADPSLFDDEVVARTRGLMVHLTEQAVGGRRSDGLEPASMRQARDRVLGALFDEPGILAHCHALALEYRLTRTLAADAGVDALLPPTLQELIASPDEGTSRLASAVLTAQTRFMQSMVRMQLPLRQLPAHLLHAALDLGRSHLADAIVANAVEHAVRTSYDEGATRLALAERLVSSASFPRGRGLQLEDAGALLFLANLSSMSRQDYTDAVLLTTEGQRARLALVLRSLGCNLRAVNRNLYMLHSGLTLPTLGGIEPDAAEMILAYGSHLRGES